jgi:serine/threonine-protein kinase
MVDTQSAGETVPDPAPARVVSEKYASLESELQSAALRDYDIVSELGQGGMGVVYKARQKSLVALKMVKVQQGRQLSERQLGRFYAEAEAVAKLQHPNIVQIYQIGENEGLPFYSMEFVSGGSLADKIGNEPQPPREAAELVRTLAQAMQVAHQHGVIHRDLKPGNVLLTESGIAKITDFGLAKQIFGGRDESAVEEFSQEMPMLGAGFTVAGKVLGTPEYMAPEQASGKAAEAGAAADIYALGAILYKLLSGRAVFTADKLPELLRRVQKCRKKCPPRRRAYSQKSVLISTPSA